VRRIIDAVFERTIAILKERRETLKQSARLLLERETLDETDLKSLLVQQGQVR
jgi:cell division protease FtsH